MGENQDLWVLNPSATSFDELGALELLGKLMVRSARVCPTFCKQRKLHRRFSGQGYAIRSKNYLGLRLPRMFWKSLVGEPLTRADLAQVDETFVAELDGLLAVTTPP